MVLRPCLYTTSVSPKETYLLILAVGQSGCNAMKVVGLNQNISMLNMS